MSKKKKEKLSGPEVIPAGQPVSGNAVACLGGARSQATTFTAQAPKSHADNDDRGPYLTSDDLSYDR